ncbi:MAG: 2-oxoglutarate dehydrogenase E1 subunit family protein, partial [Ilumatobacteraceae bacterium]
MTSYHYATGVPEPAAFGANSWLVEEMYERFCADPDSVGESWKEFFSDYRQ